MNLKLLLGGNMATFEQLPSHADTRERGVGSLLSQVTIIGEREGGLIDAMVPVEYINREEVPVDQDHVEELKTYMQLEAARGEGNGTGQLSPILIGDVPDSNKFLIIDGFHRDAALHQMGSTHIFATIRTNSSLEDVLDLRILTANTHASVTFARINEWINDAWARSDWANKLTVVQAFALTTQSSTGKVLKLSPKEVGEIKLWVKDKCKKWRASPTTIHNDLVTGELADPLLVKEARRRTGGHALTDITPQHLGVIAKGFPGEGNYAKQRLAARLAKENNMNVPTTRAMVGALQQVTTLAEMRQLAKGVDWKTVAPVHSPSRTRELAQLARQRDSKIEVPQISLDAADLSRKLVLSELQASRLQLGAMVLRGIYTAPLIGSHGIRYVEVDARKDEGIHGLTAPVDVAKNLEVLGSAAEKYHSRLLSALLNNPRHNMTTVSANRLIQDASSRITADIENGDLRFTELDREMTVYDLLVNTVRDALRHQEKQGIRSSIGAEHEMGKPMMLSITDVIAGIRIMADSDRRALIAHGILGLSAHTTAALIRQPMASKVQLHVLEAQKAISKVVAGGAASLPTELAG